MNSLVIVSSQFNADTNLQMLFVYIDINPLSVICIADGSQDLIEG